MLTEKHSNLACRHVHSEAQDIADMQVLLKQQAVSSFIEHTCSNVLFAESLVGPCAVPAHETQPQPCGSYVCAQ